MPQARRDALLEQRGDLNGHEQIEGHNTPSHGAGLVLRRCERHQQITDGESDERIDHQRHHVHADEDHGEPPEEPMEIEQPGR